MNKLLSKITSLGRSGWKNLGFAQKAEKILSDGFDISTATEIGESDLVKIFAYRFTPGTLPFFIISTQEENIPKRKLQSDDIDKCYKSDWYAYIYPNSGSDIIIPIARQWIGFNPIKKIGYVESTDSRLWTECNGEIWGLGGGKFQLDKNLGKQVIHTQVSIESMQTILAESLS